MMHAFGSITIAMTSKGLLILVLFVSSDFIGVIRGDCRQSYVVFCDCVTDVQNYRSTNWTEVIIDSTNASCSSTLNRGSLETLDDIKILFVVGNIADVEPTTFATTGRTLKFLKFYGNDLHRLGESSFSGFRKLSQLGLSNNNVRQIDAFAFQNSEIKNLDLSRNKLETIIGNAFAGGKITRIKLQYNKLSYVSDDAFAEHLEVLKLDYNNLEYIQPGFGGNLPHLKELSISHNKLSHLSDLKPFEKIKRFDFSFNNINSVDGREFEDLKNLEYLDLSGNKLETFSLHYFRKVKAERITLLLAYNRLTNLNLRDVNAATVTLFGNPWNCQCLTEMEKKMREYNFTTTECDFQLFKSGHLPICVEQGPCRSEPVENRGDLRRFSTFVSVAPDQLNCDLFRNVGKKYIVSVR